MKHFIVRTISALLLLFLITSCDPAVDYKAVVQNDSSYDLVVSSLDSSYGGWGILPGDSISLPAGGEINIIEFNELGGLARFETCELYYDPILVDVVGDTSLGLNFDINDNSLWNFTIFSEDRGGGGECECRVVVLDEHIE